MQTENLRPHIGSRRFTVSQPGRLTAFETRRREHRFEQAWLAGHTLREAAKQAQLTPAAALAYLDRVGVRLMPHVQSEVA
jgi:hypothetical protein